jgi:selenocysteine-specific elongation factor
MIVIGTAGHVDHGKSTLVHALTGIDPDRLAEERARGMTIDLGFAWLTLDDGREVSIVDVPGHERFIRNMLAGVGGIDAVLLVIAADEGMMPQTREHLTILDVLGIRHGIIVLTKVDLVEPDWLALVRDDISTALAGSGLAGAPLVEVAAPRSIGLGALRSAIAALCDRAAVQRSAHGTPRLSVDRAFSIAGFGTVVTGTLLDGPLRIGDEIEFTPTGLRGRVRGLQMHRRSVAEALPGARVAVNVAGVARSAVRRGDMLAPPGWIQPSERVDARLHIAADAGRPVEQNMAVDIYVGAAEVRAAVTLLDAEQLAPGSAGWVQLRLAGATPVSRGDRFVIRQPSPGVTLGGGVVLAAHPPRHRRHRPEVIATLAALARGTPEDLVCEALADGAPQSCVALVRATGLTTALLAEAAGRLVQRDVLRELGGAGGWLIAAEAWRRWAAAAVAAAHQYHQAWPLRRGLPLEALRQQTGWPDEAFGRAIAALEAAQHLVLAGDVVALPGFSPQPTASQRAQVAAWQQASAANPWAPPSFGGDDELLAWLVGHGAAVRLPGDIVLAAAAYHAMVQWIGQQLRADGQIAVGQVRDQFQTTRRYALAVLEHLDAQRITRRIGDVRVAYRR